MIKNITMSLYILASSYVFSQNSGTYDVTFSGDGKDTYIGRQATKPFVFLYNNEYITFANSLSPVPGNASVYGIFMIKHDLMGNFISVTPVLSDSAASLTNMKDYILTGVKQTNNGKFVIATHDAKSSNGSSGGGTSYKSVLRLVDATGVIDINFGTSGKRELLSDIITNSIYDEYKTIEFSIYSNNLIVAAHSIVDALGNISAKVYKLNAIGSTVSTATIGTGSEDYQIKDIYASTVGSVNSFYLSGVTNFNYNTHQTNFIFKLTNALSYDNTFNSTSTTPGKLFIDRGDAMTNLAGSGGGLANFPYPIKVISKGTNLYTYIMNEDTLGAAENIVHIQQYTTDGVFVAEKKISTTTFSIYDIRDLAIDNAGKIVAISTQDDLSANNVSRTYIVRLNPTTLTYDNTFNSNGRKTISFSTNASNYAHSFLIQNDDKIIVASESIVGANGFIGLTRINGASVTNISNEQLQSDLNIMINPNPTSDIIRLSNVSDNSFDIEVYDVNGKLVKVLNSSVNQEISITDLNAGLYFLKVSVTGSNVLLTTQKLIVN